MKVVILIIALITLSSALPSAREHWASFKVQHGKSYSSPSEEQYRLSIFMDNLKVIEEHNAKYDAGLVSYSMRVNKFADKLPEELSAQLNGFTMQQLVERKSTDLNNTLPSNKKLPTSIDWRKKGAVTEVKYQENCGGCWAFSATGSLEGQLFRKTGRLVSLSEQQLIDCSNDYNNHGCSGGLMDNAFEYIKHAGGLETEDSYPYLGEDGHCSFKLENVAKGSKVKSYVDLPRGDEETLQAAVATVGPVSVAVSAGNTPFLFYNSGIFDGQSCVSFELNHGVLIVGYGSENGEDYWIIKNSWSAKWGEKGYMKLARNKGNVCGIASLASYPVL